MQVWDDPTRNTVGNIPMEYYADEDHIGYNIHGKKIMKTEVTRDKLDEFLAREDDPNFMYVCAHESFSSLPLLLSPLSLLSFSLSFVFLLFSSAILLGVRHLLFSSTHELLSSPLSLPLPLPLSSRTVRDVLNQRDVVITEQDYQMIRSIIKQQIPSAADGSDNAYLVCERVGKRRKKGAKEERGWR